MDREGAENKTKASSLGDVSGEDDTNVNLAALLLVIDNGVVFCRY